jgi:hypothetical protein
MVDETTGIERRISSRQPKFYFLGYLNNLWIFSVISLGIKYHFFFNGKREYIYIYIYRKKV